MLRIVSEQQGEIFTISLHGRIAGEWVGLLERYWRGLREKMPSAQVTTVLTDVSFIDAEGERLLERMWRRGVKFVASGCMNRHLIERIQQRSGAGDDKRRAAAGSQPQGTGR